MSTMLLLSLLAATDQSLQPIDPFDDVAAWSVNDDGGQGLTFRAEPGGALRITFDASGQNLWGNLRRAVSVPPNAVALRFRLKVLGASPEAGMHVWFMEADGDGYPVRVRRDEQDVLAAPQGEWREVTVPLGSLGFEPRGNGKRAFLTVNRLLLGLNFAPAEILVDDLAWVVGPGRAGAPLPVSAEFKPVDGAKGRVAILDEPAAPRSPGAVDIPRLAAALTAAGYGVTRVRAGDVADPQRLTPANFDLLLLPAAPGFPAAARDGLLGYLRAKGAVLSVGGYAFDRPLLWNGTEWVELGSDTQAADLDKGVPEVAINSRHGKPGDTMGLDPAQVGLFDPQDTFTGVAYAELGGKRINGPLEGFVARSLAGSNSPVFPDQHGETETYGQAYDRLGRPRGALGVACHLYAGPYAGAAWGGFGVSNRDLFAADAAGTAPLLEVVDRLVSGVYLRRVAPDNPCVRDGETVRVQCQAGNRSRRPRTVRMVLKVDGKPIAAPKTATLAAGGEATLAAELRQPKWDRDFYRVTAELYDGERLLMTRETAFCAWQPAVIARGHKPVWRGNYFEVNGRPAFLTGTNQTGVMWYSPREDPLTWDRDFEQMEDHGFFVWRVLHFSPFADPDGKPQAQRGILLLGDRPPDRTIRQTDAIMQLAQKHGVVVFLTAHDWMGCSLTDAELDAQRKWNRFWADRYRDVPGLIWDIQNEPSVEMGSAALYAQFLAEAHGSLDAAKTALGYGAGEQPLPQPGDGSWGDLRSAAVERFRTWLLQRWVAANAAGLKEGNPDAIFTVGYLQDRHSADKVNGAKGLTFANMHCYESSQAFVSSFRWLDHRAYGQGLSLGEFGSVASHNHRVGGGTGLQADLDRRHFTTTIGMAFGVGGAFACNWFWRDMPDVIFPWGLFRQDRVPRPWVADMAALTLATRAVQPVYEPPALYLLIPDNHRLGARFGDLDRALTNAIAALSSLSVPFAVLHEDDLPTIPESARALIWPLPYCPTDATFETVRKWVAGGGRLYVSGGLGYDEQRKPTRGARYAALGLPEQAIADPFDQRAYGPPATGTVGTGKVTLVPEPAELRGGRRERYAAFLADAGIQRLATAPDAGDIQCATVASRDGSRAWVAANWGPPRDVTLGGVTVAAGSNNAVLVHLGQGNALRGVLAQGNVTVDGKAVVTGPPCLLQTRDGKDVRESAALLLMPLAAGELSVATSRTWRAPVAVTGEVRAGKWHELARTKPRVAGGALRLTADEALVGTAILIAEPGSVAKLAEELVAELRLR